MAAKISMMYKKSGGCDYKHYCETCDHIMQYGSSRKKYKCLFYGDTGTPESDWNPKELACKFYKDKPKEPVVQKNDQIEGQLSLFDFMN